MRYSERGTERYKDGSLGYNEAEARVEAYFAEKGVDLVRFGPQGAPTQNAVVTTWPSEIRHAPDYLSFAKFIEVKSCWDDTFKFKLEDIEALEFWNRLLPVWVALYVAKRKQLVIADFVSLKWACSREDTELITLDEGTRAEKPAYLVKVKHLTDQQVSNAFAAATVHPNIEPYIGS